MPTRIVDGLDSEVLPQPYHMQPTPTPRRKGRPGVEGFGLTSRPAPMRLERLETLRKPGARLDHLAGCRLVTLAQGIAQPELEGSMPHFSASSS